MKGSKLLPVGFAALVLAGTGAMIATAQTTPVIPDAPAAEAPADMQAQRADAGGERGGRGDRGGREHRGGGHFGGHFGGRGGEMMRTIFDTVDADGDGTVTQAEIDTYRAAKLAEIDASGDGALSIEEFDTLYRELTRSRMVDAFQDLDADGDGAISPEEMDTRIERIVERLDRDGDGALTLQRPGGNN